MGCYWTRNMWINAAVATVSASQRPSHETLYTSSEKTSILGLGGLLYERARLYMHTMKLKVFQGSKFSNMNTVKQTQLCLFSPLLASLTLVSLSLTHTPAITLFHLQLCIFTTSHLVSHTAITLSSKHPLQPFVLQMCRRHQVCQIFTIPNYPAAGMPLLLKISCSH